MDQGQDDAAEVLIVDTELGRFKAKLREGFFCSVEPTSEPPTVGDPAGESAFRAAIDNGTHGRLPFQMVGTDFQILVWSELRLTKPGERVSYSEVARRLGRPNAARAVASACAANRLCLLIPCHRVVKADGSLSGYRWGTALKSRILEREATMAYPHG